MSKPENIKLPTPEKMNYKGINFFYYRHPCIRYINDYNECIYYEKHSCGIHWDKSYWNSKLFYSKDDAINAAYTLIDELIEIK